MPFIGRDWRSPGEAWVKTKSSGWQKMEIVETFMQQSSGQDDCASCLNLQSNYPNHRKTCDKNCVKTAPHCRISVRTREVAMYNTISEAFYRLDFCNAIHDIRRFNYICKLLHLLITQNLTSLSGCATKVLFTMLEQVAWEVSSNKRNIHVLKNLLEELKQMIQKYYCWGRPIGSSALWQQHFNTIDRIRRMVEGIELSPPKSETSSSQFNLNNLPVEMIHEVLLRLNDYRDLVNSAQASPVMRAMIDGQYLWKQMCKYHFTEDQLKLIIDKCHNKSSAGPTNSNINNDSKDTGNKNEAIAMTERGETTSGLFETKKTSCPKREVNIDSHNIDWQRVFHQSRKKFGLKEEYADCLLLCRHCRCLFWKSIGHPCIKTEEHYVAISPQAFLKFFSL